MREGPVRLPVRAEPRGRGLSGKRPRRSGLTPERTLTLTAPSPDLTDGVVTLRPFRPGDAEAVERWNVDPLVGRWMSQLQRPAEEFLLWAQQGLEDGTILLLAICEDDGRALGGVAASADPDYRAGLGYWLLPEGRGRGLATRALRLLSRWLIDEAGCPRCHLWVEVGNDASRRVVERAGFELEGVLRSYAIVHDRRADSAFYSLLPEPAR